MRMGSKTASTSDKTAQHVDTHYWPSTHLQFRWCQVASVDHLEDIIADAFSSGGELGVAVQ